MGTTCSSWLVPSIGRHGFRSRMISLKVSTLDLASEDHDGGERWMECTTFRCRRAASVGPSKRADEFEETNLNALWAHLLLRQLEG